ncbi:hypothetical protein B0I72DRAFT_133585 [Yarrowia lipolytica]|nr:hypothetical protein BKA90DRAFT_139798 [Yarrowia lipolytica]QNP97530.1 Hypothetical protein YALI2_C01183g [Yarrowia lipolytica]RDW24425.1 hypothetical protein B0I71DRAFT_134347 [Yarrowia lipolytica]RDW35095.1 hypothetical protein B0I72DRAFT_133585 [Yarrowia lipolytica]RDW38237.1 hypothetical protein B0I73DRAFT_134080 [Yarrowia lipolytica]
MSLSLPPEIITMVCYHLDTKSLLALEASCSEIRAITSSRFLDEALFAHRCRDLCQWISPQYGHGSWRGTLRRLKRVVTPMDYHNLHFMYELAEGGRLPSRFRRGELVKRSHLNTKMEREGKKTDQNKRLSVIASDVVARNFRCKILHNRIQMHHNGVIITLNMSDQIGVCETARPEFSIKDDGEKGWRYEYETRLGQVVLPFEASFIAQTDDHMTVKAISGDSKDKFFFVDMTTLPHKQPMKVPAHTALHTVGSLALLTDDSHLHVVHQTGVYSFGEQHGRKKFTVCGPFLVVLYDNLVLSVLYQDDSSVYLVGHVVLQGWNFETARLVADVTLHKFVMLCSDNCTLLMDLETLEMDTLPPSQINSIDSELNAWAYSERYLKVIAYKAACIKKATEERIGRVIEEPFVFDFRYVNNVAEEGLIQMSTHSTIV